MPRRRRGIGISLTLAVGLALAAVASVASAAPEDRRVLFGDTHLHTSWSPDANMMGNRTADPDTAYRFAKGLPVIHPAHRARVKIETPLDFLAVSDHAEFMGIIPMILANDPRVANSKTAQRFAKLAREGKGNQAMRILVRQVAGGTVDPALISESVQSSVWGEIAAAADRHYEPGSFTTLLAWEWSAMPGMSNLHRIVMMREGADVAKRFLPLSSLDDARPETLWSWLEETSTRTGASFIAMPHNSNLSLGRMFEVTKSDGTPIDAAYARTRARWEPIVEITQVKGDSETHPTLSPTDEFADFETFPDLNGESADRGGDHVRSALRRGLEIAARVGVNPFEFGIAGATDSHTGLATAEERNFLGKFAWPSTPEENLAPSVGGSIRGIQLGAQGLVAAWAEENTRESIFDAFARREVYATTGPRIALRVFAGWDFDTGDLTAGDLARRGYRGGVPMGGVLTRQDGGRPGFLVQAARDPEGAHLDRIQIVKGWIDAHGDSHERVYDAALSDGRRPGPDGRVPPVGNTVDRETGRYANSIGDASLSAFWEDPDFDPAAASFYYVRVLEIPTPRHSLLDAIAVGVPHEAGFPRTIQERAYSSPVFYAP